MLDGTIISNDIVHLWAYTDSLLEEIHAFVSRIRPSHPIRNTGNAHFGKDDSDHGAHHRGDIADLESLSDQGIRNEFVCMINETQKILSLG